MLAPRVVDMIVDQIESTLIVDIDADGGRSNNWPLQLNLQLAKDASLLSGSKEGQVLAFTGVESRRSQEFAPPANGTLGRHENETRARSSCVRASQVRGVTVPPNFC